MPQLRQSGLSKEVAIDSASVINGYENANPPALVATNRAYAMLNRFAAVDNRNRCRPGINRIVNLASLTPPIFAIYYTANQYLLTDGSTLWGFNSVTDVLTVLAAGLPFSPAAGQPNINGYAGGSGTAGNVVVINQGGAIYHWDGTNLNLASMPVLSPNMSFPIWTTNRLVTARTGSNDVVFADLATIPFNWGPLNNDITVRVTLDIAGSDQITGLCAFGVGTIVAFKKGRCYAIYCNPTSPVANFPVQQISGSIGCAEHNTAQYLGSGLFFLSETGRGVFAIGIAPATSNLTIAENVSARIQPDIDRINWAAIATARSAAWQGLYLLAVPLDGAVTPNAIFVYSPVLDEWQGIWSAADGDSTVANFLSIATNPSGPNGSELLYGFGNGDAGLQSRPLDNQFEDEDTNGDTIPIQSQILSRGFHWDGVLIPPSAAEQPYNFPPVSFLNQVEPYNIRFRFSKSLTPVIMDVVTDQNEVDNFAVLQTTNAVLQLPHDLPWNLDSAGDKYDSVNVQTPAGTCNEIQVRLTGVGQWTLQKIEATAFVSRPMDNQ